MSINPHVPEDRAGTAALAARYFDEHIAPTDRASGMPEHMTAAGRERYIAAVLANPEAAQQIRDMYAADAAVRAVVEATDPAPNPTPPPQVTAEQLRHRAEQKRGG